MSWGRKKLQSNWDSSQQPINPWLAPSPLSVSCLLGSWLRSPARWTRVQIVSHCKGPQPDSLWRSQARWIHGEGHQADGPGWRSPAKHTLWRSPVRWTMDHQPDSPWRSLAQILLKAASGMDKGWKAGLHLLQTVDVLHSPGQLPAVGYSRCRNWDPLFWEPRAVEGCPFKTQIRCNIAMHASPCKKLCVHILVLNFFPSPLHTMGRQEIFPFLPCQWLVDDNYCVIPRCVTPVCGTDAKFLPQDCS